jgi:hypothetical protein
VPYRDRRLAAALAQWIAADAWMMDVLRCVARLGLPDWWIGAGFVRRMAWDRLTRRAQPTPLADIDVLYFDRRDRSRRREADLERRLRLRRPGLPWSVKNQARMHRGKGEKPYRDSVAALRSWLETPTCVAVTLARDGRLRIAAPCGLADLFALRLQPTAAGRRRHASFRRRLAGKPWLRQWPELRLPGSFREH